MSSLYKKKRAWSDLYEPQMNQLATHLILENNLMNITFTPPTYREDALCGVDQYIDIERLKVAYRVRKWEAHEFWRWGFTLRTPHELKRVMSVKADGPDYMLYAVADEHEEGKIASAALIDLKSVGYQLNQHPEILREAEKSDYFIDLSYGAFPEHVVVGMR